MSKLLTTLFTVLAMGVVSIFISLEKLNLFSPAAIIKETQNNQITLSKDGEIGEITPDSQGFISTESDINDSTEITSLQNQTLTLADIVEQLDDISEKVDILVQETNEFIENSKISSETQTQEPKITIEKTNQAEITPSLSPTPTPSPTILASPTPQPIQSSVPTSSVAPSGGGNPINTSLPQILISEVAAGWDKAENEFIELYNPNDREITLTKDNFKLKLVNSSNVVTTKRLDGLPKTIAAYGYFLLVAGDIALTADASFSDQLTDASGVIITDGEDDIKDKVSWGKPTKLPPAEATEGTGIILEAGLQTGKSLEREKDAQNNLIDTDNNSQDFQLQINPSPKNSRGETISLPQPSQSPTPSPSPSPTPSPSTSPTPSQTPSPSPSPSPATTPPATPTITSHQNNQMVNFSLINLQGSGEANVLILTTIGSTILTTSSGQDGIWQQSLNLNEGQNQISVKARDAAGNESNPTIISINLYSPPAVVINEIMYDPEPGNDSYYEYIEFFNTSAIDINLANWILLTHKAHSLSVDTTHDGNSAIIKSGGFAIIGDKTTGPNHIFDGYYNIPDYSENIIRLEIDDATLSLNNEGATIALLKTTSEQVDGVSYFKAWGGDGNGKSLERVSPQVPSDQMNSGFKNWLESQNVGGTPGTQNSVFNPALPIFTP